MKVTARNQDPEYVTTLLQSREESSAKVLVKNQNHVKMVNVLLMEIGGPGHLGHLVGVIVQSQDPGNVIIHHQEMKGNLVL